MAKIKPVLRFEEENWTLRNSFVMREIRRCNRNVLLAQLVLFALLLFFFIYPYAVKSYISKQTPAEMPAAEVLALTKESLNTRLPFSTTYENSNDYRSNIYLKRTCISQNRQVRFTLTAEDVLPSGIVPVKNDIPTIEIGGSTTKLPGAEASAAKSYVEYVLLRFGDKYLLTKQPVDSDTLTLSGMLCYLPSDVLQVASDASGVPAENFIPVFFDAGGEIFETLKVDMLLWCILFLIWVAFFIPLIRRIADPTRHEAYDKIYVYAGNTEDNIRELDRELGSDTCIQTPSKIVTASWIITRKTFTFEAKMKDRA